MDCVIVFGPDKEDPLDDELDLPEADIKDRNASLFGEFESALSGEFDNQLGMNLIRNLFEHERLRELYLYFTNVYLLKNRGIRISNYNSFRSDFVI